jgi:ABC-type spermidine/putrescine transport system permease subunit I
MATFFRVYVPRALPASAASARCLCSSTGDISYYVTPALLGGPTRR